MTILVLAVWSKANGRDVSKGERKSKQEAGLDSHCVL